MTKTNKLVLSVFLIFSVLTLSACASKPKEAAVVELAPSAPVTEQVTTAEPVPAPAPARVVVEEQAPAPVVMAQQPAPVPVVQKPRKKVVKAKPKVVEPEPVVQPEPVAAPEPVVQQEEPEPAPPVIAEPVQEVAEPGFLEQYWLWILGLVVGVIALLGIARIKD